MLTLGVVIADADGDEFQGGLRCDDDISITDSSARNTLLAAIQGVSVGSVRGYITSAYTAIPSPVSPGEGAYSTVQDRLDIKFRCEDGSVLEVSIPAPDEAVFLADAVSVDPSSELIIALGYAVAAYVISSGSSPVTEMISGKRHRVEYRRP